MPKNHDATPARVKAASAAESRLSAPRWDNNRVLFQIDDGDHLVECAISRQALAEVAGRHLGRPSEFLACFSKFRSRIEQRALDKARAQAGTIRPVTIWSGDLTQRNNPGDRITS
jgi:hypothetical protein